MKEGESVNDFFSRTVQFVNKMKYHGEKIPENNVVEKVLRSFSPKFNYVVCSIEQSNNLEELSIDELQSSF